VRRESLDHLTEPASWTRAALEACLQQWLVAGARYARRLRRQDRLRDAADDVLALAARRVLPLRRAVLRPLPDEALDPLALAFNRLDHADRRVLLACAAREPPPPGLDARPLAEHRASALQRLVECAARPAARTRHRPPPRVGDGR
jgi:hypothetical protein